MSYLEMREKWSKIIANMPYGVDFEFEVPDGEAQVLMELLDERADTIFTSELLGSRKSNYVN